MGWYAYLKDDRGHEEGEWNYTSNCNQMAQTTLPEGSDHWLDLLNDSDGPTGAKLLDGIIRAILSDPQRFEAMNPDNGWGDRQSFLRVLTEMRNSVPERPTVWKVTSLSLGRSERCWTRGPTMNREGLPASSLSAMSAAIFFSPGQVDRRSYPSPPSVESPPFGSRARTYRRRSRRPPTRVVLPAPVGAMTLTCSPGFQVSPNHSLKSDHPSGSTRGSRAIAD